MACWVVPAIAADIWGVPATKVWEDVRSGKIPSRSELGFTLVDVAPDSQQMGGQRRPAHLRPATYKPVQRAQPQPVEPETPQPVEPSIASNDEPPVLDFGDLDWREVRQLVSTTRRRPMPLAA